VGYAVKEIFYTLQGEGAHSGRAAVFLRFAGCNLWSGRESDRRRATCQFCDTDFVGTDGPGGGRFADSDQLANAVLSTWQRGPSDLASPVDRGGDPYVVCTGGEPLLQLDPPLLAALHARGLTVAVETNGTIALPSSEQRIDWVCVSPKAGSDLVVKSGDELKLVYPQPGADPAHYRALPFRHFFLQPMAGPKQHENTARAVHYCLTHPTWRLSLQTHKLLGIP
jgi:7-carboxy-7-deazaguanine synthase (Cx14CxxC type)